jgi:hypothetical protein
MRRRNLLIGIVVASLALATVGLLGIASAEAPTGATSTATISVEGVGTAPIGVSDSGTAATAVYREGMAKALADAQTKGVFLATNSGTTLAGALNVTEQGGYIECASSSNPGYAEYEGEQPDFGEGVQTGSLNGAAAPESAAAVGKSLDHVSHRPKVKRGHPEAKKASVTTCTLTAEVSVVYSVS